jgi:hypothetical protein
MRAPCTSPRLWLFAAVLSLSAAAGLAAPPPEGRCPSYASGSPEEPGADAGAPLFHEGSVLAYGDLLDLARLFPSEVWGQRDDFFYEGMRMEIGACHRRYPVAAFYAEATERFAGKARLDKKGNLLDYVAGVPFPQDRIDPKAEDAALRWAWNFQHRYRGAGPVGTFRLLDLPSRIGSPEIYRGSFFYLRTAHRADLVSTGYRVEEAGKALWVAGGRFDEPFNARHLAWRQIRPLKADRKYQQPDDTFVYVPTMRKPRRSATPWVDGMFTPRYSVSGDSGGGGMPFSTGSSADGGVANLESIAPTAGISIAATEHLRKGFTGLALRPNAYTWELLGEQEVLAPLNASTQGYPGELDRNYGPSGLSVASDRWDVRQAVVLKGRARRPVDEMGFVELWVDWQTLQPLYYISRRKNGGLLDVGILAHRFSGDQPRYAAWPGGEPARVFDPVAAVFVYVPGGGSGWRRESFDVTSLPVDPTDLRKLTSTDPLVRGH